VIEAFPENYFIGLFVEVVIGIYAGVDENLMGGDEHSFGLFQKLPMFGRDMLPPVDSGQGVVGAERVASAGEAPGGSDRFVVTGHQRHDFVITAQESAAMAFAEVDEAFEDAAGIGAAIDVVAEEDELVVGRWIDFVDESFQAATARAKPAPRPSTTSRLLLRNGSRSRQTRVASYPLKNRS